MVLVCILLVLNYSGGARNLVKYILTDRSYPSVNSMVMSICVPLRLNPDQMRLNFVHVKLTNYAKESSYTD